MLTKFERALMPMDSAAMGFLAASPAERRALLKESRAIMADYRAAAGFKRQWAPLLTQPASQPKLRKSLTPTYGLTLAPHSLAIASASVCPMATAGCKAVCLTTESGKGKLNSTRYAREVRARFIFDYPRAAGVLFASEMLTALARHGDILTRLNVGSDIRWEYVIPNTIVALFNLGARFYDYTKWSPRNRAEIAGVYTLTYSASERHSLADIRNMVAHGHNVAVVMGASKAEVKRAAALGLEWEGMAIVDGISSDDRTRDGSGVIVALAALGTRASVASGVASGFVRHAAFGLAA